MADAKADAKKVPFAVVKDVVKDNKVKTEADTSADRVEGADERKNVENITRDVGVDGSVKRNVVSSLLPDSDHGKKGVDPVVTFEDNRGNLVNNSVMVKMAAIRNVLRHRCSDSADEEKAMVEIITILGW